MTGRLVNICNHIRGNNLLSESALYTKFWNGYSIAERYAFIYSNIEVYPSITFRMRFKAWFRSFQTERLFYY